MRVCAKPKLLVPRTPLSFFDGNAFHLNTRYHVQHPKYPQTFLLRRSTQVSRWLRPIPLPDHPHALWRVHADSHSVQFTRSRSPSPTWDSNPQPLPCTACGIPNQPGFGGARPLGLTLPHVEAENRVLQQGPQNRMLHRRIPGSRPLLQGPGRNKKQFHPSRGHLAQRQLRGHRNECATFYRSTHSLSLCQLTPEIIRKRGQKTPSNSITANSWKTYANAFVSKTCYLNPILLPVHRKKRSLKSPLSNEKTKKTCPRTIPFQPIPSPSSSDTVQPRQLP